MLVGWRASTDSPRMWKVKMDSILEKLSSYNIFNYLLPGVLFAVFGELATGYSFTYNDLLVALFLYYFIGLVVSRFGSLVLEPLAKRIGLVKFVEYPQFLKAAAVDPKIEVLSEANNTYRTLLSVFVLTILLKLYELLGVRWPFFAEQDIYILVVVLTVVFL